MPKYMVDFGNPVSASVEVEVEDDSHAIATAWPAAKEYIRAGGGKLRGVHAHATVYVDRDGAAELFAVSVERIKRYERHGAQGDPFPASDETGRFSVAELKAWRRRQLGTREPPRLNLGEAARELGVSVDEFRRLAGEAKTNGGVVDGRRFPAPKGGLNPTYAVAGLRVWKNPDTGLVDIHGVADMIGVNQKTVRKYATEDYAEDHSEGRAPWFPRPDDVGLWKAVDIRAWLAARAEAGPTPRPKGLYACGRCGTEVPRRWKFKPTEDPADEEFLCKPCLVVADRELREGK